MSTLHFDQMDDLLQRICEKLQINPTQQKLAKDRYETIGEFLASDEALSPAKPAIYPQGSLRIGTTVKPLSGQEFDVDLVCELFLNHERLDPVAVLNVIESRLKANKMYLPLIERLNRCIRINYANEFHLDILPACPDFGKNNGAVKVPDRKAQEWKDSNPKGYAGWFEQRSMTYKKLLEKVVEPLPHNEPIEAKPPLKRVVQLMKRFRDISFQNDIDVAPISIILTTLAASFYKGETSVNNSLTDILLMIKLAIETSPTRLIILNPTNHDEDFSEKWDANRELYKSFVQWISKFNQRWEQVNNSRMPHIVNILKEMFGENVINIAIKEQADFIEQNRRSGLLSVSHSTGTLTLGTSQSTLPIRKNTFYGSK